MRVGFNIKAAGQINNDIDQFKPLLRDMFIKQQNRLAIKKSIRVLKWEKRSGYDGDDFMHNMFTVAFTGKGYRISRIIKRFYK